MFTVERRFHFDPDVRQGIIERPVDWKFGALSSATYYRTYSRYIEDEARNEHWGDTVLRVGQGLADIGQTWEALMGLKTDDAWWERQMNDLVDYYHSHKVLAGRSSWALGTEQVNQRGSMALFNCAFCIVNELSEDLAWSMDALMHGVGVGYRLPYDREFHLHKPAEGTTAPVRLYIIPDSREGWVESVRRLIESYERPGALRVEFDYSEIRPKGALIRTFGGVASGPAPLMELHLRIRQRLDLYCEGAIDRTMLIADLANLIGKCVVAGNVRRSAQILLGRMDDKTFMNLKNADVYPERNTYPSGWSWLSNNSVMLDSDDGYADFQDLAPMVTGMVRNGEPGWINLHNVRHFGRFGEERPDNATGTNPCVPAGTRILTGRGYRPIEQLVGVDVPVWDGSEWTWVTPRVTGYDQRLVTVRFDDGTEVTCTPYHRFPLNTKGVSRRAEPVMTAAQDLKPGDALFKFEMPVLDWAEVETPALDVAYTQGAYSGDGYVHHTSGPSIWLYEKKDHLVLAGGIGRPEPQYGRTYQKLDVYSVDKNFVPHGWSIEGRVAWLAGLIDTDGYLTRDGQAQITSIQLDFLKETRLMLTTLGVQAKIKLMKPAGVHTMPDGQGGVKEYNRQDCYRLLINATDIVRLRELGLGAWLQRVDVSQVAPQRDARQFVRVTEVVEAGYTDTVYCFTNEINGTGTFEGVVTGNCGEILLADHEVCNLVEVFPTNCRNEAEIYRAFELATFFATTVSLLPTHRHETNETLMANRRIGVAPGGFAMMLDTYGYNRTIGIMRNAYKVVDRTNELLARKWGIPRAIRLTTSKPSGTLSLLAGASPGVNRPFAKRYVRRVTISEDSPVVERLLAAGVPLVGSHYSPGHLLAEFPIEIPGGRIRPQAQTPVDEQAATALLLSRHFVDNAVSSTLTSSPQDVDRLEAVVSQYVGMLKTGTVMIHNDAGGGYDPTQTPYQGITVAEYQERAKQIGDVDWSGFAMHQNIENADDLYCTTDSCLITLPPPPE